MKYIWPKSIEIDSLSRLTRPSNCLVVLLDCHYFISGVHKVLIHHGVPHIRVSYRS